MFTVPLALLSAIPFAIYCWFRRDADRRRTFARRLGVTEVLLVGALFLLVGALFLLFVTGELMTDVPAGEAWRLTLLWSVPMAVCSVLAIRWSRRFRPIAVMLVALLGIATLGTLVWADEWRAFVNDNGPVLGVASLALALPLALLGLREPRLASRLLLITGVVPLVGGPSMSGEALASPILVGALWASIAASPQFFQDGTATTTAEGASSSSTAAKRQRPATAAALIHRLGPRLGAGW